MKQTTLDEQDRIGVCRFLVDGTHLICGTKLVHLVKGNIDYWFCPKCNPTHYERSKQFILSEK